MTVIEALPAPLAGILGEEVGSWFADFHREQGVEMRLGAMLEGARGNGSVEELVLAGGERIGPRLRHRRRRLGADDRMAARKRARPGRGEDGRRRSHGVARRLRGR